ncbi:MAG TPA: conditioned medium factor, partial [Tahibacter sp.]|nr:conditioned medium factor [Tahibacter sp.]
VMRSSIASDAPAATKGTGQRLILVHGYCSGGVWPASQFTTASTFLDTNQNRSHDAFARLLQTYGSTWASFGTVAHSQGGAAALHLYTYYWSGLDYATGSRLMQSVGTPYQGTNLAGILATLGSWFGVGCGTNDNLSYSGATAWLAGIPNANRAKVNYYTTAFKTTNWWTNDYCNVATDLVLNDPEDGTTEQSKGQLPGAVNRGHTTGQCHTTGMRDPAQYQDASRNATMNANAAR